MNITIILYDFYNNSTIVKVPFEIIKETEKCFFTKCARYLKSEIGVPILKSATSYPYIELIMIDADEKTMREELSKWFIDKSYEVIGEKIFTAFAYEDGGIIATDSSTYDTKEEAIEFAKVRHWDEVVNDITGEVVWRR